MPNVHTLDQVNHLLCDVTGVITDALEAAQGPHFIEYRTNGAGVFHHKGDKTTQCGALFRIYFRILHNDINRHINIEPGECIQGSA